jgi:16S rRNA (cytidine1402-2'-O)-methyltransferase
MSAKVFLVPTFLHANALETIPPYVLDAIKACSIFFVEEERTARRFMKQLWKEMVIDDYQWVNMKEVTPEIANRFRNAIRSGATIGILSEAGCPGVADPGQKLVEIAQEMKAVIKPLVGPSSILLALMASGMNGQQFSFVGYLPVDSSERAKTIRAIENESRNKNSTQIFIETPYRNNQLMEALTKNLHPQTRICVAVDLTGETESVQTKKVQEWRSSMPELHKRPAIFLVHASYV